MSRKRKHPKSQAELEQELDAMLEVADEVARDHDMSQEAWMAHLEGCAHSFNQMNRTRFDPHDAVMKWITDHSGPVDVLK